MAGLTRPLRFGRRGSECFSSYTSMMVSLRLWRWRSVEGKNKGRFPGSSCLRAFARASAIFSSSGVTFLPFVISARVWSVYACAPRARTHARFLRVKRRRGDGALAGDFDRSKMRGSSSPILYHEIQFIENKAQRGR